MLTRTLVQKLYLTKEQKEVLDMLSRASKSLYNEALYRVREHYEFTLSENQKYFNSIAYLGVSYKAKGGHLNYFALDPIMQSSRHYKLLGSAKSQEILRLLDKSYKSWFNALKVKNTKGLRPKPPMFKRRDSKHILIFNYTNFGFNGKTSSYLKKPKTQRYITLSMSKEFKKLYPQYAGIMKFQVPAYLRNKYIKMIRILPVGNDYKIEFVYEVAEKEAIGNGYMAIDLGLRNFATYVTSTGKCGIIDGSYIKSENRYYNKEIANLKSITKKQGIDKNVARAFKLTYDREAIINNFMSQTVNYLVNLCLQENIITVAIGELKGIKQEIDLGKKTNQSFVQIPYYKFKTKLNAKLELYGIKMVLVDEAYTSQTDAFALDKIGKHDYGNSRRVKRGLYDGSASGLINADINGAVNILRKVADEVLVKELISRGSWTEPRRIRLAYDQQTSPELNSCISENPLEISA